MATDDGLRYVDSDGHILEHPTAMPAVRPGGVPGPHLAHRDGRGRRGVAALQREPDPGERHGGGRGRRGERRRSRPRVPRGDALHGDASGGLERQGPPPGHGPGPYRPGRAVSDDAPRAPERARRRLRGGAGPRLQRLVLRPRLRGRGSPVRGGRSAAHARAGGRRAGGGGDPSGGDPARHGVGVHAAEPGDRLAAVQRPGLRPALAGGLRHRAADRAAPVPGRRPARDVQGPPPEPAPQARRPVRRRLRPRAPTEQRRAPGAPRAAPDQHLHPGDREPVRRDEQHRVPDRRRRVRALPRREVHLPGGQRRLVGPVAGAHGPPLPEVPVGGCRPVDAAVGVLPPAVLDQLRPGRGDAAHDRGVPAGRRGSHHLGE